MNISFKARCPICSMEREFLAPDAYWSCRSDLRAGDCPLQACIPRSRALAHVLFSLYPREEVPGQDIHECSPAPTGISLWLRRNCPRYVMSGFFPDNPFGQIVNGLRNEDLERQTFDDAAFDLVVHMDVLEHLFNPFQALREIERTLRPGGRCLFTAPTYSERVKSEQVAFHENGSTRILGTPEHHGNPQDPIGGSLVTWRYGYDLPVLIAEQTGFDVEVRRWHARSLAIVGPMTEVYILTKSSFNTAPRATPTPIPPLAGFDLQQILGTLMRGEDDTGHQDLPRWPTEDVQRRYTGGCGMNLLQRTKKFVDILEANGAFGNPDWRGLDYGCGWGRIASYLLTKGFPHQLDLCDSWQHSIDFLSQTKCDNKVLLVSELLRDNELTPRVYDFCYAFSVFTHLSKEQFINNFPRLVESLKTGGRLFFTVRFESFFKCLLDSGKVTTVPAFDKEGFWHTVYPGKENYGETVVTPDFVTTQCGPYGEVRYLGAAEFEQHLYCLVRR